VFARAALDDVAKGVSRFMVVDDVLRGKGRLILLDMLGMN
jgi:hypothetical protein